MNVFLKILSHDKVFIVVHQRVFIRKIERVILPTHFLLLRNCLIVLTLKLDKVWLVGVLFILLFV